MAKAPTTAKEYDGSGQRWFKIVEIGPTFSGANPTWPLWRKLPYISHVFNLLKFVIVLMILTILASHKKQEKLKYLNSDIHLPHSPSHTKRRISPPDRTTRTSQPWWCPPILHLVRTNLRNWRRFRHSRSPRLHSRSRQRHRNRIYRKYLQQLQELCACRAECLGRAERYFAARCRTKYKYYK